MADRRLPYVMEDREGARHRGEVVVVREWGSGVQPSPDAAFTVVLAQRPIDQSEATPDAPNIAVCAPASPVRLPAAVAEAAVAYDGAEAAPRLRLTRTALGSYAAGSLLTAEPLTITAREVFGEKGGEPRIDVLARELLLASDRAESYWAALDEVLSWPRQPERVPRRDQLLKRLRRLLAKSPASHQAGERLQRIVDGEPPERVAGSAAALADDVAALRCLSERPEEAVQLAEMRRYMDGADPGERKSDLTSDYRLTREQLSYLSVLEQPHVAGHLRATFEQFRARYSRTYVAHHAAYWDGYARLRRSLDDAAATARALARLNSLRALGRPVGQRAIAGYERLVARRSACAQEDLDAALRERPACPSCGLSLADTVPGREAEDALRRLQHALGRQQARLASEAVRRILAQGGARIEQFLQVVQASDLAGLAQVLDDELVGFLSELLSEPVAPTQEALDLFEQLGRSHPVVSEDDVDALLQTLRDLLIERLASQREADPTRPPAFLLASGDQAT